MLKCSRDRWVCAPHNLSPGTSTTPRLSVSFLISAIGLSQVAAGISRCGERFPANRSCEGLANEVEHLAGRGVKSAPAPHRDDYQPRLWHGCDSATTPSSAT